TEPYPHLTPPRPVRVPDLAVEGRVRPALPPACLETHGRDERLPEVAGLVFGSEVCPPRLTAYDHCLHPSLGPGALGQHSPTELLTRAVLADRLLIMI